MLPIVQKFCFLRKDYPNDAKPSSASEKQQSQKTKDQASAVNTLYLHKFPCMSIHLEVLGYPKNFGES